MNNLMLFLKSNTNKLAMTYLAIVMFMSLGFSVVFYNTSSNQLGRQLPPSALYESGLPVVYIDNQPVYISDLKSQSQRDNFEKFFKNRITEGKSDLIGKLILVNLFIFIFGAIVSYELAKRTMRPIEKAMEAQDQFVSDASHELKTPLTIIRTTNEVALRNPNLSKSDAKDIIKNNLEDVSRLQVLTEALLRLSTSNRDSLVNEKINLYDLVEDIISQFIHVAKNKKIKIVHTSPKKDEIITDWQNLSQAVSVLLDNAIKFSNNTSQISINHQIKNQFVYINVADQGIGIEKSEINNIFKRFYQTEKSRNKQEYHGHGVGLSIADKLIKQLNGEILVKSKVGKGSTFTIKIPSNS